MAIYHLSVKTVSRSAGRSATAAVAYRCGVAIADERTGQTFDYRRRRGVMLAALLLPASAPSWAADRATLWNAAESAESRRNSTVAREFEIAIPAELDADQRQQLVMGFAQEIVERHGCAVDVAIHAPSHDHRNHHAHLLLTTRRLNSGGLGEKTRELDCRTSGTVTHWRQRWEVVANAALAAAGSDARIDHRTLAAQGIARKPTQHLGPQAHSYEQRTGLPSNVRQLREAANAPRAAFDAAAIQAAEADVIELEAQLDALQREQREQQRRSALLARMLDHDHALARLPLVPTAAELAQHLRDWPEPKLRELALEQVRRGPLSIPSTDERYEVARLQKRLDDLEQDRSALRASVKRLCEERDLRQRRPWILRLFDQRLPHLIQQIEAVERRWDALRAERRTLHDSVLQAQAAASAADNAARAAALAAREAVIREAIQAADAPPPLSPPPQELARAQPAPATPEQPRLRRNR